jgi:hypothetical protein
MNGKQLAGQLFLWAGFISAALAATCQREFDFLPDAEKDQLAAVPNDLMLNSEQLATVTTKKFSELSLEELTSVVAAVGPISEANKAAAESSAEAETDAQVADSEPEAGDSQTEKKVKNLSYADFEKGRTTLIENKWPTVPWLWYGLSMAVGLVGVVLLRSSASAAESNEGRIAEDYDTVTKSLAMLNERVGSLGQDFDSQTPKSVVDYIDGQLIEPFADFAESRNAMVQRFGMQPYAEVMTQFASAERFVNRAWSASADGYMNEARDCIARSTAHLQEAQNLVTKYESEQK